MIIQFSKFINESKLQEYEVSAKGIDFIIKGYFYEGDEKIMYYPDGSGYPGSRDTFDIQEIWTEDEDGNLIIVDDETLKYLGVTYEELEDKALEQISD